jgi:hypothetical protein
MGQQVVEVKGVAQLQHPLQSPHNRRQMVSHVEL